MKWVVIFLCVSSTSFAQKIVVKDSKTMEVIPFANLVCKDSVYFSNENGEVNIKEIPLDSSINIFALGYKNLTLNKSEIIDSIFLEKVDHIIPEIVVLSDKRDYEVTKRLKDSKKLGSQILACHTNVFTKISSNETLNEKRIASVKLPFQRHIGLSKEQRDEYKDSKLSLRLNIYAVKGDSLGELLYTSIEKNIMTGKNDELSFSLRDVDIRFSEKGFFIQLENLGAIDEKGEFINCTGLFAARLNIADRLSKEYQIESYRVSKNGFVNLSDKLNYSQVFGENDLDKDYFINYQFTYYD